MFPISFAISFAFTFFPSILTFRGNLFLTGVCAFCGCSLSSLFSDEQQGEPATDAKTTTAKSTVHMKEVSSNCIIVIISAKKNYKKK